LRTLKELLTPVMILILVGVILYDHFVPRPTPAPAPVPAVNGVALGRTFAPVLASTYAVAWQAAAQALEEGKSVADAQKVLQDTWKAERVKAFATEVGQGFGIVLPEGTEPTDPAKRAQVVELWRSFAKGLTEKQ
jgi:hypothetical protein